MSKKGIKGLDGLDLTIVVGLAGPQSNEILVRHRLFADKRKQIELRS